MVSKLSRTIISGLMALQFSLFPGYAECPSAQETQLNSNKALVQQGSAQNTVEVLSSVNTYAINYDVVSSNAVNNDAVNNNAVNNDVLSNPATPNHLTSHISPVNSLEKIINNPAKENSNPKDLQFQTVPILMYHEIGNPNKSDYGPRFTVTPDMLREHLLLLYNKGFVPVSLDEFLCDNFSSVPKGKTPLLLTFDDSTEGQFRYLEQNGRKVVDKNCAVGILEDFASSHNDFRAKAVFFVDFVSKDGYFEVPFLQKGVEKEKIRYLSEKGYDVQCHTVLHPFLNKDTKKTLVNNVSLYDYIMDSFGIVPKYKTLAYPYGDVPQSHEKQLFLEDKFDFCFGAYGNKYGSRAYRVNSNKFLRNNIPRIEINNDFVNLRKYVISGS